MKKENFKKFFYKQFTKKKYCPNNFEKKIYYFWEKNKYFELKKIKKNQKKFCVVMPPPNITGNLHIGHALQNTIMDIMIRYNRMKGKNTLWQIGTDHAGIATQMIIENKIFLEEKKLKKDYGKKRFIEKIWKWKKILTKNIYNQIRRLGSSVSWKRKRFTMDKNFNYSVKEAFIKLYKDNLIYQKKTLVNWNQKSQTVLSDLEVGSKKINSYIWFISYKIKNKKKDQLSKDEIIVATTRPETIFGDVAIAVNPNDKRYKNLVGKKAILPILNRSIPIIKDESVDINIGTGCVKITPAHSFNDYKIAKKHKLPIISVFNLDGHTNNQLEILYNFSNKKGKKKIIKVPEEISNLNKLQAREIILKKLEEKKHIKDVKPFKSTIFYNIRDNSIIEPMILNQWYLKIIPLAKNAISIIKKNKIKFIPKQYKNLFFSWMKEIEDWCISRQLWWGHRIPIWFDRKKKIYVGHNKQEIIKKYKLNQETKLFQEKDVLDTWFSSALWIFASLGWPKKNKIMKNFYPTDILVSGFDIIFFWISRIIMFSSYFIKKNIENEKIPFKKILITGLIKDENGKKMSKSKGNVIDPIDLIQGISIEKLLKKRTSNLMQENKKKKIIEKTKKQYPYGIQAYGSDSLRIALTSLSIKNRNIHWNIEQLNGYKKFCNKIWNVSKFIIFNLKKYENLLRKDYYVNNTKSSFYNIWITTELNVIIKKTRNALDLYNFDKVIKKLYKFIWNQFCDWYIEISKIFLQKKSKIEIFSICFTLAKSLKIILLLLHPIAPFITEIIWQNLKFIKLKDFKMNETIMLENFPKYKKIDLKEKRIMQQMKLIKKIIIKTRSLINKNNLESKKNKKIKEIIIKIYFNNKINNEEIIKKNKKIIKKILKTNSTINFKFKKNNIKNLKTNKNKIKTYIS